MGEKMINDHKLLRDMNLIDIKKFIIWGVGEKGKDLAEKMLRHTCNLEFVDSNLNNKGKFIGIPINKPEILSEYSESDIAIVIPTDNVELQVDILHQIKRMGFFNIDIYTKYAVEAVLAFRKEKFDISESSEDRIVEKIRNQNRMIDNQNNRIRFLEQMVMAELVDKSVYVYQSKKVASVSIILSAKRANVYGIHVHDFKMLDINEDIIRSIIKKTSGKVISIVREPIARQISLMWQYWGYGENFLNSYNSIEELEKKFYSVPNAEDEFEWYKKEFEKVLHINIYEYPFNREKGYSIIEKDGISLLLLKMEKINSLEKIIGNFLEAENFTIINGNMAEQKGYHFAYENYLENVKIPLDFYKHYYSGNEYMDYFYTEDEKNQFYKRWKEHIVD